jgi:D-sedoheptulose 7-phosphate isomerase
MDFKDEIKKQINESANIKKEIISKHLDTINEIANCMIKAYKNNKKILWCGNGGSAADSQHLSCELVSKFLKQRKALPSIALTTNSSILTAVPNDYDFVNVFERQVEAFAEKGDILVGISTSGTSPNIVKAFEAGKKIGTINIGFCGKNKSAFAPATDYIIDIPSNNTPRIQECHITIGHILCYFIEKTISG